MEPCILTIGTVTRAIRARKLLSAARIQARLFKHTGMGQGGCAYALSLSAEDMPAAMRLLQEGGIPFEWSRGGTR